MNLLIITADDLSGYSLGYAEETHKNLTPNLNQLAAGGTCFLRAYTNAVFCQPARSVLMSGLYPHNNGSLSFNPMRKGVPTLAARLMENGYTTVIVGKTLHHEPWMNFKWNVEIRNPKRDSCLKPLRSILKMESPWFILFNSNLVHRPFKKSELNSIDLPPFLEEIKTPEIDQDYKDYCNSIHHLDDLVGELLELVDFSNTLVIFTSDHGMSFPFAKGNCYELSTNIPLIWSGPTVAQKLDNKHLVSSVDLTPSIIDYLKIKPWQMDGKSYLPICQGKEQSGWETVYVQLTRMMFGPDIRMRSIIDKDYCYVVNFDKNYPAKHVDGWGFEKCLNFKNNHLLLSRENEELHKNNRSILKQNLIGEMPQIRLNLRRKLLHKMYFYQDPLLDTIYPSHLKYL